MAAIADNPNPWREGWRQASFKGCPFHVEVGGRASGRRIVEHEFPKRDKPYAEDMGRKAQRFPVTGYLISYPNDDGQVQADDAGSVLRLRDYRVARDQLIDVLEQEGEGTLVHPTLGEFLVVCESYSIQDAIREKGGYCQIDMLFLEAGSQLAPETDTQSVLDSRASQLETTSISSLNNLLAGFFA